jgi:predicted nucleic acid-binding protein
MIVIADTSPLSYLVRIGEVKVLPTLYRRITIPPSVYEELRHPDAPALVRHWMAQPLDWLDIRAPRADADAELLKANLDPGERDAILLAQELGARELIIDDLDGRREAQRRNLHFVGTLGVMRLAADRALLDFTDAVERLRATNFHVSQGVIDLFTKTGED